MGTNNGLSRFDGTEFNNYKKNDGLPDNKINVILSDRQGKLWIGTDKGCMSGFFFDNQDNSFKQNNLTDRSIYSIVEDGDGKLWFATSRGLSCFDGKEFRNFTADSGLLSSMVFAITIEKKRKLWIGTEIGISCFENGNFIPFTATVGLKHQAISTLLYDSTGSLWIGTKKGLYRFQEAELVSYTRQDGLCDDSITALKEDRNGNIWIGTWNGVSIFSKGNFTNYSTINGLPNNFIYSIAQDREGNIWLGTDSGASCLASLNLKTYTKDHGLPSSMIIDIIQDKKGRYWFATPEGVSCYNEVNFSNYTTKDGLISNTSNALMEDYQGNIWIATIQGLSIFSSGSFTSYKEKNGLPGNILFTLAESRNGTTWIGGEGGIIYSKNGNFSAPPFKQENFEILYIIEDSEGNLWFSSRNNVYKYSRNRLISISNRYGLIDSEIYSLFEDSKGKIWICTVDGLCSYDKGKFTQYSIENSALLDNACFCILDDHQGNLWIGHAKGISCFNGKEFKTYTSERLRLSARSWLTGLKDNQGNLWFGTTAGLVTFDPPPVQLNSTPSPAYITGVKVMEKEIPLTGNKTFTYDQNIFRFNFVGISFTTPSSIQYKYRLENIDKDWQITKDRSLFYPFLPPNSYTLKVKAVNADGFESKQPAEYSFIIRHPFWQTWWFMFLLVLFLSGCLLLVLQWRVRRTREKAEFKAKQIELEARNRQLVISQRMELMGTLAAGTVHDLKNLLAVIIGYSRLMAQKYRDKEDHQDIEIIKDTAATAVQMAKQILSFTRQKNPSHESVDLGMEITEILDTLKITQPKNIHIMRQLPSEPLLFPINPARFQQLVMNLCLNAFQAMLDGGQLTISLSSTDDNEIILNISDTGAGIKNENLDKIFDPFFTTKEQSQGTGLGLFVVKQIVEEYQGKIEVHSDPGKGTAFIIRFPAPFINN